MNKINRWKKIVSKHIRFTFKGREKNINSFIGILFPMKIISADVLEKASPTPWYSYKI